MATKGITGLILAGGKSTRLGRDKALLPWPNENSPTTLLHHISDVLAPLCDEVLVVANRTDLKVFKVVKDVSPVGSSLTGLTSGLEAASTPWVLAVACDMPFLNSRLLGALVRLASEEWDAVAPVIRHEPETLHTVYHRRCHAVASRMLEAGDLKLGRLMRRLRVREFTVDEVRRFDTELRSTSNINTPGDLELARELAECSNC